MLDSIKKALNKWIKEWVSKATDHLLEKIKEKTPEDTTNLINSYKVQKKNKSSEISNSTEYAKIVEDWLGREFNYHKNWSVYYRGYWAGMIKRTETEEYTNHEAQRILEKAIDESIKSA